jgi:hypothetical protein
MAGVTDYTFRELCRRFGAGLAVSEMMSSNPLVWQSEKSLNRMTHQNESGLRSVQIAGSDPDQMAEAAVFNVEHGAQIIDINMGCPAKKVNKKLAGSALLQYPDLVQQIIQAVVQAVTVPVTLKIRTGWDIEHKNGVQIAQIAQDNGIVALAVHGRTKACMYKGEAEYDTIRAIKQNVSIPVIANGDITTPEKARLAGPLRADPGFFVKWCTICKLVNTWLRLQRATSGIFCWSMSVAYTSYMVRCLAHVLPANMWVGTWLSMTAKACFAVNLMVSSKPNSSWIP